MYSFNNQKLNAGKAHKWDKISIGIIKLCGKSIISINTRKVVFLDDWKKNDVVPIHQRDSKNYHQAFPCFQYSF